MQTTSIRWCTVLLSLIAAFPLAAGAQDDPWARLVAEADSLGPQTPRMLPTRRIECGPGVQRADSMRISGRPAEFLLATTSRRTRGYFQYLTVPSTGTGTFAIREVYCDGEGRPYTFVLERDHRYFFLIFSLRDLPTYSGVRFLTGDQPWSCRRWDQASRRFDPVDCPMPGGSKC
ncbi:MAG TPA: hypothetical protein VMY38_07320 [Gemmatimonadaceae bacterium]|nr:hypothetical protein [Gemmatimonadaceae bacterium]